METGEGGGFKQHDLKEGDPGHIQPRSSHQAFRQARECQVGPATDTDDQYSR